MLAFRIRFDSLMIIIVRWCFLIEARILNFLYRFSLIDTRTLILLVYWFLCFVKNRWNLINLVNFCDGSCGGHRRKCGRRSCLLQALILLLVILGRSSGSFVLIAKVDVVVGDVINNIETILFLIFVSTLRFLFQSRYRWLFLRLKLLLLFKFLLICCS